MNLDEMWHVRLGRLIELEHKEAELPRAKALIGRLRAENRALKREGKARETFLKETAAATLRHICIAGNTLKKYGAIFMVHKLGFQNPSFFIKS